MNARADIDLVLPCYNPPSGWEERVATHFREVERLFSPVRFHLFIVSDGSRRGYEPETIDRLRQLIPDVCVVDYKPNRGKGYALREAVKRCTSPYIIYTDYDFPYTNIEEFDAPLEHGVELPFEEQMRTSVEGTRKILACLARHRVKATFFCTANFALHAKDLILDIQKGGHEIASHGFYHSSFETADLRKSKEALEELTGQPVNGFRMARMMPVEEEEIHKAGYLYNSSLNPTCIPGRYNHLGQPRTYFMKDGVLQLPASVTPIVRFPLFWLAYHNLPATLYRKLALWTWKEDGYFLTYFHPWEFTSLSDRKELKLPFIMTNHSGCGMERRLDALIRFFKDKRAPFGTYTQFSQEILSKSHGQE